jgi:hypothetical protein
MFARMHVSNSNTLASRCTFSSQEERMRKSTALKVTCLAVAVTLKATCRYLYNKLGSFFGLQEVVEAEDETERALLIRMHVEVVTKANTGRAHYIRRATLKDGNKLLFRTWEKEAMAQLNDCVNKALGEPSLSGQSPAEAEIAALKDRVSELERLLAAEAREEVQSGGGSASAACQSASVAGSGSGLSLPTVCYLVFSTSKLSRSSVCVLCVCVCVCVCVYLTASCRVFPLPHA